MIMSANSKHVEASLDKIRTLFNKASEVLEALPPGGKVAATQLAETIGKDIGIAGPQLYPTLKFLFGDYPGIKILRGAHGGLYKLTTEEVEKAAAAQQLKVVGTPVKTVTTVVPTQSVQAPTVTTVTKPAQLIANPPLVKQDSGSDGFVDI
jgi:hypothetical protein